MREAAGHTPLLLMRLPSFQQLAGATPKLSPLWDDWSVSPSTGMAQKIKKVVGRRVVSASVRRKSRLQKGERVQGLSVTYPAALKVT